ncbi:MAG: NUDIX domain-containing protein [Aeropyrum sp.]|nr:NUDIX domain-containing protein [Aeropyrum sp.]
MPWKHRKTPVVRARCIIADGSGRLLVQWDHKRGAYTFPGGRVEYYESIPLCLVREMMEEAGIDVEPDRLLYIVEVMESNPPFHEILFYFNCKYRGTPKSKSRYIHLEWRRPEEVKDKFWPAPLAELINRGPAGESPYYLVVSDGKIAFIKRI